MSGPDAIVVGGGLNGLAAAVAVAKAGLSVVHVAPRSPPDRRTSALMGPSVDYLRSSGLIDEPAAIGEQLIRIRIIDATDRLIRAPETLFDATEFGLPAFGWNFPNTALAEAFERARAELSRLDRREAAVTAAERTASGAWRLTLADGTNIEAPLLVGADGKKSMVRAAAGIAARERSFGQSALVADLELGRPLAGTSVEFHYPQGPFTLVPAAGNRANLVWIDDDDLLLAVRDDGEARLREVLVEKSQRLFGSIEPLTRAFVFPLSTLSVERAGIDGAVLVGEAAHAFPPIGAQGLNLGLRDVADLAATLAGGVPSGRDWALGVAEDYARRRESDLARTGTMVDTLFRSLLSELLPAQALRATGLWALRTLPPLRRGAVGVGMGIR